MKIKETLNYSLPYQSIKQFVSEGNDTFTPCELSETKSSCFVECNLYLLTLFPLLSSFLNYN